ncbi:CBO0543 family protein [Sporomusa sp.]|uniref:CBO0543 family protein n=1 Tax=Sporomusa sp. TaxID=2078658 RepID=UPI002BC323E8|nr:CBO0543 family protein [Sporomusa sp.]HWR44022.1 CBO0543 family protein [Sporomusa sp.]
MLEKVRTFPTSPSDEQIAYALKHLTYARIDNWLDTDFNTFNWWLQIALAVFCLVVWWRLVDKKRLLELTFYGFTIMTVSIWLDQVGYELGLWYYPVDLIPVFPPSTAIDYVMLPVTYALIYQYCQNWKSFIPAICLMAGVFSFVLEPLLDKFGFYVIIKWKFYYGFPIYIAIGLVLKSVVDKMKAIIACHQGQATK